MTRGIIALIALLALVPSRAFGQRRVNIGGTQVQANLQNFATQTATKVTGQIFRYFPVGSVAGVRDWRTGTYQLAASNVPLTSAQWLVGDVHIPYAVGTISFFANIIGVTGSINLSPGILARIYQGAPLRWNDASIQALNPGVRLPPSVIRPVARADGAESTELISTYLKLAVPGIWKYAPSRTIAFPNNVLRASGDSAVIARVKATIGGIGYAESASGLVEIALPASGLGPYILPRNSDLNAFAAALRLPRPTGSWYSVQTVYLGRPGVYPITFLPYLITRLDLRGFGDQGTLLKAYIAWFLKPQFQSRLKSYGYRPLPQQLLLLSQLGTNGILANGRSWPI